MWTEEEGQLNEANSQQYSKGNKMQPRQRLGQPLVVTGQPPETSSPGKAAFHYPSARQQHEASFSVWQLDYLQPDTLTFGSFKRHISSVARIYIRYLHVVPRHLLHLPCKFLYLCSVLLIGGGNM